MKYPIVILTFVLSLLIALIWLDVFRSEDDLESIAQAKNSAQKEDALNVQEDDLATVLTMRNRPGGVTYEETVDLQVESLFSVMGVESSMIMDVKLESETSVDNLAQGGQVVHTVVLRSTYSSKAAGFEMACDTDIDRTKADALCDSFYDMVGIGMEFTLDDEGNLADSDPNAMLQEYSPSTQIEATSRLLKFIPQHPVQVGDSWDASVALDGIGYFTGKAVFEGFVEHDGSHCAFISTNGTFDIDFDGLTDSIGVQFSGDGGGIKMENCSMASKLYWDDAASIPRWSETVLFMIVQIKNPLDNSDLTMPMHEIITTTCNAKE